MKPQPMQPIVRAKDQVIRFQQNQIVHDLLEAARAGKVMDMNTIAAGDYRTEDREQFAQLIGYSVSGFGDLSYARPKTVAEADRLAAELSAQNNF